MEAGALISELKRRRVFRALVGYGTAAFAVLQIIEQVVEGMHWPREVVSYVVVALAVGFPIVVSVAWIFDVNAGRIERTGPAPASGPRGVRLGLVLVGIGVLAAAPGVVWYFFVRKPTPPSIAVLPFADMSAAKDQEYFSDGIAEEILNALAQVNGLKVAGRTSSFVFKGKNEDLSAIGQKLHVTSVLEGSVRKEGNHVRITAQLVSTADGYHLWSKTYDRELRNVFALEDEIAQSIVQALRRTLVQGEAVKPATASVEAHDLYLKGRYFWNKRTLEALRKAADLFEQAIREDPGYALAWTGLSDALALRIAYDVVATSEIAPKARAAAQRALEIDPGLAEAHCSLGNIAEQEFDWTTALKEFRTAIELKPGYATAHHWLSETLVNVGRFKEARAESELALEADPTALIIISHSGFIEYLDRNYSGAFERYRKTLEMDPSFEQTHLQLLSLYIVQKKPVEAAAELERMTSFPPAILLGNRGVIDALAGRRTEALRAVQEIEEQSKHAFVLPSLLANIWVTLGEKDKAFPLLLQACALRDSGIAALKVDPFYDGIRSDPRFAQVLKCMNLE